MPIARRLSPGVLTLSLAGLLLACGGHPPVLDGLDAVDRDRIAGFETTLDRDRLIGLVPDSAPQRIDLRPGSLVASGLARYLPILAADLAESLRNFEAESGVPALEAFHRLIFWSEAATVDGMDQARAELLFALDGATLIELIRWLERSPATADDPPPDGAPAAEDAATPPERPYGGVMFLAAFSRLDASQQAALHRVMHDDPQRVDAVTLGPSTRLFTARGVDADGPWSMWAYAWPGGFLAERGPGPDQLDPARAARRIAGHLRRIEAAARATPPTLPEDRVLTARIRGPDPVAIDLDMGEQVGMRFAAPAALFDLQMPPSVLAASWPMMKLTLIGGLERSLRGSAYGEGFGPLIAGALRASELRVEGDRLVLSTALPRQAFEALLPTL